MLNLDFSAHGFEGFGDLVVAAILNLELREK